MSIGESFPKVEVCPFGEPLLKVVCPFHEPRWRCVH